MWLFPKCLKTLNPRFSLKVHILSPMCHLQNPSFLFLPHSAPNLSPSQKIKNLKKERKKSKKEKIKTLKC